MLLKQTVRMLVPAIFLLATPAMAIANTAQSAATAGGVEFSMAAGVESWAGDITYSIGFPVTDGTATYYGYFPFSELTFPLDAVFGVVEAETVVNDKFILAVKVKKDAVDPDSDMEDRDWITFSDPSRLDIYSDSEVTDFSALIVDIDGRYSFYNNGSMSLAAGIGYMYQNFEYETAVLNQWSPSGLTGYDYVGDGSTSIIYEVDADLPYLVVSGQFSINPGLRFNGRVCYAPWVIVEDKDQHLLRDKVNTGDLEGSAVMVSVDAEYNFTPAFYSVLGLDHTFISVDGDMDAAFNGVYDHTVSEELESSQTSLFAKIGFRFGAANR